MDNVSRSEFERVKHKYRKRAQEAEAQVQALSDLISSIHLHMDRHEEIQLTTEQKELLYDVVDAHWTSKGMQPVERWWHTK